MFNTGESIEAFPETTARVADNLSGVMSLHGCGFNSSMQHTNLVTKMGVLQMKQRPRIYYTQAQKSEIWDRWQNGESMSDIAKSFNRYHTSLEKTL